MEDGELASRHGSCSHGCWPPLAGRVGGRGAGGGTFSAPQEATGKLAAVQRALEKGHWKKD